MKLILVRACAENVTRGDLYLDNKFFAKTLEDPVRPINLKTGAGKIFGETAIPAGTYEVGVTFSARFRRQAPLIMNVPWFTGIRLHPGRTVEHTHGCILLGESHEGAQLQGSSWALVDALSALILAASNKGKVYLKVVQ